MSPFELAEDAHDAHNLAVLIAHEGRRQGNLAKLCAAVRWHEGNDTLVEALVRVHTAEQRLPDGLVKGDLLQSAAFHIRLTQTKEIEGHGIDATDSPVTIDQDDPFAEEVRQD